jgi:hypothetical protein
LNSRSRNPPAGWPELLIYCPNISLPKIGYPMGYKYYYLGSMDKIVLVSNTT